MLAHRRQLDAGFPISLRAFEGTSATMREHDRWGSIRLKEKAAQFCDLKFRGTGPAAPTTATVRFTMVADLSSESAAQLKIERNRDPRVLAPRRHD
jgi:hypothetical protein